MKVETKIRQFWQSVFEQGDLERIAKENRLSRVTISRAYNGRNCTSRTFCAINEYFLRKKENIRFNKEQALTA